MNSEKHVLGLSGGRDSAALAVFMRERFPELDIEYYFTDTGKELPEVYEFLGSLEGFLGKPILRLNPDRDFDFWLKQYGHFLPSPQTRWCTVQLKLRPFEAWVRPMLKAGVRVISFVAIRSDESYRQGYAPKHPLMTVELPFRDQGIDKPGVMEILEASGVGLPDYYRWRSRSGCTFCFYQQKIEWVNLSREHPEAFKEAISYEKEATESGSPFTWSQGESLHELALPERTKAIEVDFKKRQERSRRLGPVNHLRDEVIAVDFDDIYCEDEGGGACLVCHK